jgi:hypothetical protein
MDLLSKNNTRVKGVDSIIAVFCSVVQLTVYSVGLQMYMYVRTVCSGPSAFVDSKGGSSVGPQDGDCITSIMWELHFTDSSCLADEPLLNLDLKIFSFCLDN